MRYVRMYFDFFFGTPRRGLTTIGGLVAVYLYFHPQVLFDFLNQLFQQVIIPLFRLALTLVIMYWAVMLILRHARGGGGKKK